MALIDDVKTSLRVSTTKMDAEIEGLIDACKIDLVQSGVKNTMVEPDQQGNYDAWVKRAITVYCKAFFGYDNNDSEKLEQSYKMLKTHLALSLDYGTVIKN